MKFITQIEIQAPVQVIWNIMLQVERWHEWTPTINSIKKLGTDGFGTGTKLLIEQPKLPTAVWKVFEMKPEEGFSMAKENLFLKIVAAHILQPASNGTVVSLSLEFSGIFGKWVAKKYQQMMEEYLAIEAACLKKEAERVEVMTA
jgi:hypothetical protein